MRPDHYTPETICRCIELPGFETDPDITSSGEAIRLLLQPSFHPEVCITFKNGPRESAVSVVAARTMVWHLLNPAPVLAEQDQGEISMECFTHLATALAAASGNQGATSIVLDGMPVNALLMRNGELLFKVRHNAGPPPPSVPSWHKPYRPCGAAFKARHAGMPWSTQRRTQDSTSRWTLSRHESRLSKPWSSAPKTIAGSCWTR